MNHFMKSFLFVALLPLVGYGDEEMNWSPEELAKNFASVVDTLHAYRIDQRKWPATVADLKDYPTIPGGGSDNIDLEYIDFVSMDNALKVVVISPNADDLSALIDKFPEIDSSGTDVSLMVDLDSVFDKCISDNIKPWSECSGVLYDRVYDIEEEKSLFPSPWVPSPTELATQG